MRTYDEDPSRISPAHPCLGGREGSGMLAQRALGEGGPGALDALSIAHFQRQAGNGGVTSLVEQEEPEARSPVLDVVGSGGGQALEAGTRAEMEAGFGHDFADVRIHTGAKASESAKAVHAQAYTVGNDVVFGGNNYAPGTSAGKRMLAHELTHVVQQRSGPVDGTPTAGGVSVSDPSDRFELAAETTADRIMAGTRLSAASPGLNSASLQREADDQVEGSGALVQRQETENEVPEDDPAG